MRSTGVAASTSSVVSVITLRHLPGKVMIADVLTKAVERPLFIALLRLFDAYASDGIVCPG